MPATAAKTTCTECKGSRLRKEALYVKINGKTIADIVKMPISDLKAWFDGLTLDDYESKVAKRLLAEIRTRLEYLCNVGLEYLTLDRLSSTLSGGESQRINLATSLGSNLVGSLYILDEPSIGLHSRDTEKLLRVLRKLQSLGNTVVVVEHDEEIMRAADYIIDIGPNAGRLGGEIVYQGPVDTLEKATDSLTVQYLTGERSIPVPKLRRRSRYSIDIHGAAQNNLKGIDVKFPLGVITVVSGVSGSGKSTLVRDILYKALSRKIGETSDMPGAHAELTGDIDMIRSVEFVDQKPNREIHKKQRGHLPQSVRRNPETLCRATRSETNGIQCRIFFVQLRRRTLRNMQRRRHDHHRNAIHGRHHPSLARHAMANDSSKKYSTSNTEGKTSTTSLK